MVYRASVLTTALIAGLATAPVARTDNRHGQEHWHGGRGEYHGNNVAPAIIGGLIGLGVGAAIASGGYGPSTGRRDQKGAQWAGGIAVRRARNSRVYDGVGSRWENGSSLSASNSVSLGVKRELIWIKSVWLIRDHN
jgi:hypothetical protein